MHIIVKKGQEVTEFIDDVAKLRIEVFRHYPYLYNGNLDSEMNYLKKYFDRDEIIAIFVKDREKIVGVSTAIPLEFENEATIKPFVENGYNVGDVFYLSESVLLPEYRSNNIYPIFFREREKAARKYGSKYASFCCVKRPNDHPSKPADYRDLSNAWQNAGYTKQPGLKSVFSWKEVDQDEETSKEMQFWLKKLP